MVIYTQVTDTQIATSDVNLFLICVEGILIYTSMYIICIVGPLELAKVEMLNHNLKFIGIFFCVLTGLEAAIECLFFENLIFAFQDFEYFSNSGHFYFISAFNLLATIVIFLVSYKLLR